MLWAQTLTNLEIVSGAATRPLDPDDWSRRRLRLKETVGSPLTFLERLDRRNGWHEREAATSELAGRWFAARWHLSRLIEATPGVTSLYARRGLASEKLGQWVEAERDYGEVIRAENPLSILAQRGVLRAQQGRWVGADADFAEAAERGGDVFHWFAHAVLRLQLGDLVGYRATCERMVDRFERSSDPYSGKLLVVACTEAPEAIADRARLVRVSQRLVAANPNDAWSQEVLGRALHRGGRSAEARQPLAKAVQLQGNAGNAWHWLFLALVCHDLGRDAEARTWLAKASKWIDQELTKAPQANAANSALSWNQGLELQFQRREAEALINQGRPLYLPADVFHKRPAMTRPPR
jgi:tetratricopeptide (TPR) repeat protein